MTASVASTGRDIIDHPLCDIDPADHPREFRRCLGQFATGITVITAEIAGDLVGMTANSFSSLSLNPPLILWSLDRGSSRFDVFNAAKAFAVNVLAEDQIGYSRHFATGGSSKFDAVNWCRGDNGAPLLEGTAAFFECDRHAEYDGGDHRILVGRVTRAARFERSLLLFSQGGYKVPAAHPADRQDPASPAMAQNSAQGSQILPNLFRASQKLSAAFSQYRAGMSHDQHRVLIAIERQPGIKPEAIPEYSFLGAQAADDALRAILAQGLVQADAQGRLELTTAGRMRRGELAEHLRAMEKELFKDMSPELTQAARQLVAHLAAD